jgi:hypothetical protein
MPVTHPSRETIAAIRIIPGQMGEQGRGVFTQLPADASFIISDDRGTKNTVKVRYNDTYYLVFRKDIGANNVGAGSV